MPSGAHRRGRNRGGAGKLRVTGGELAGRRFRATATARPSTERVREAVFSHLGPLDGVERVLDCFCAGGTLGIEALSRGAASCLFVDASASALATARRNVEELGLGARCDFRRSRLPSTDREEAGSAGRGAARMAARAFDLVLADPPYDFEALSNLAIWLGHRCTADGLIVLEHSARHSQAKVLGSSGAWGGSGRLPSSVSQRRYGETQLTIVRW